MGCDVATRREKMCFSLVFNKILYERFLLNFGHTIKKISKSTFHMVGTSIKLQTYGSILQTKLNNNNKILDNEGAME